MGHLTHIQLAITDSQTFCSVLLVKTENGDVESNAETKQDAPQPPNLPAPSDGPEKDEKPEKVNEKAASSAPLLRKPGSNPLPSRAKKTMPGSPRLAGLKLLQTEPPQANKGTFTVPEKPLQSQEATAAPQDPTASSGQASEIRVLPVTPAPVPPPRPLQAHPNMQMRQNIRRSLTDTLMKRVTESDDLEMSESDVGKLAVNIEREMFNMYYTTDSKYKNKYRSLLLCLKDPKNKGLFYQVIKGQITPFKLTRLSQQELQCVQVSQEMAATFLKEESAPVCVKTEELLSACEDKVVKTESTATSSEEKASASQVKPAQPRKVSTAVSDIVSSMLKDTTSEHRAHLFDLKCKICTGQISANEDTDVKTFKKEELKDEEEEKTTPWVIQMFDTKPPNPTPVETDPIMESPASPTADDSSVETASSDFSPLVIPEVSVVSITRRDPRTASYRPAPSPSVAPTSAPPTQECPPLMPTEKEAVEVTKAVDPLPLPPPPPMPKSILMKPSAPSVPRFYSSSSSTTRLTSSHNQTENETSKFLSKQDTDLPDTIHIGGRILPQTVWEYVDKVKTSVTKEMSLIRFHPATDEEEVAYVSLFSYFNSRRRFGVVSNICNSIKDLYLIPLCAKESIPSVLLPLEGPGLEEQHPNLLIGLAICQKLKRLGTQAQEIDEKRPRIQIPLDSQGMTPTIKPTVLEDTTDMSDPYDPDIPISTTPPGSPPNTQLPDSAPSFTSSLSGPSVLSNILSVVNPLTSVSSCTTNTTSSDLPPPSGAGTSSSTTPLQTILNTLFGKRTQDTVDTCEPSPSEVKELSVSSPTFDPVVQQTPKNTVIEKMELDDNDRPYDPEEEYDQGIGYPSITTSSFIEMSTPNPITAVCEVDDDNRPYDPEEEYNLGNNVDAVTSVATKSSETLPSVNTSAVHDDVAYDPEDETVFEEMQTYLADNKPSTSQYGLASTVSLSEQQKMLEELNRQIEEQKRQLEEQEEALRLQRAAVGVSMAHFSVSDALMSPPPCFGREPEDAAEKTTVVPLINPSRDPRQCKNVKQDAVSGNLTVHNEREHFLKEISVRKQALTQATFLVPSNSSVMQDLSKPEQELMLDIKKNLDMPSVTLPDTMNTVEESSTNVNAKDLHSAVTLQTNLGASELEEGMYSSSGNENHQHSHSHSKVSGKSRQSRTSKWDNSSTKTQSRQDRRSHHEDRSSRVSRDEADRCHRKDRHSPERSSRQSRSRSNREERVSSRQRDRHHHRSTSRHRSRRDRHSTRSLLSRSGKSAQPKNDKSCQRDQSPSRQRTESVQQTQSINQTASGPTKSLGDASQNEASEDGEQNLPEVPKEVFTKTENAQPLSWRSSDPHGATFSQNYKFSHSSENEPASGSLSAQRDHPDKDLKARYQNRDKLEVLKDNFAQRDPSELLPQMDKSTFSYSQAKSQFFQSSDVSQVEPDQCNENKAPPFGKNRLHRDDFPEDESDQFHHKNQPRSEHSLMLQSKDDQIHNIQDQRSNIVHDETAFAGHRDEQSFNSPQLQRGHSSGHEADHRKQLPQKTLQIQREDFSDYDKPYSRKSFSGHHKMQSGHFSNSEPDQCYNRDASRMHPSLGHKNNFPQDEAHQMHHDKDLPLMQRHNFAQNAVHQLKERNPPQRPPKIQRRDFTVDEACHNSDSQNYVDETDNFNTERYSGNFPVEEMESGQQQGQPHRLPRLQKNDVHGPAAEQRNFKRPFKMPSQNQQGSFSVDEDKQLHIHDPLPQGAHAMMRGDLPQGDPDIPRNFCPRNQFRLRAPGDVWRGPQQRNSGPRGPPSLMIPRCPTVAMRPRMPRAPHPQGFENCRPSPNFGPRGMYPRVRTFDDAGPSPHYGPRGPSSGPGITEGSEPQTFRPRGPNPEDNSPHNFGFKSRFPGTGNGPRNFGPRGSFSGPGPRPGLCRSQHVMDGPSGPFQLNHEKTRGPFNVRGPPRPDSREHAAPQQFDREIFDSESDFRGHAPPKQFDHRDSRPPGFHGSRDGTPTHPFDEEEIDNRVFLQEHTNETRWPVPPQHSDESNSHYQNSANESFSNSLEPRSCMQGLSRAQPGSHPNNQSEEPQFPEMESGMRAPQQFSESEEEGVHKELGKPYFAKSNICESFVNPESDVQIKAPRFHSLQNFRGQRAPSPRFLGQRMPAPWNKELEDKPYSPRFSRKISPTFTHVERSQGPTASDNQSLQPQVTQPQVRFDGPPKEPDIRPLRLSGPLLPTPPGGPIRLPNPRMQRSYQEHNRPKGLASRAHSAGLKPVHCDNLSRPQREASKGLIQIRSLRMTTSVPHKTQRVAPVVGQFLPHPFSVIVSQNGCDHGPAVSSEFSLTEMTEVEYSHLHAQMEAQTAEQEELVEIIPCRKEELNQPSYTECGLTGHPKRDNDSTACSPPSTPAVCQPVASSTLYIDEPYTFSDSNHPETEDVQEMKMIVTDGEVTPTCCVEVPNSVLEKVKYAKDRSVDPSDRRAGPPLHLRPNPPARVCLEKRFNCSPGDKNRQQESQAAVLNTFLSMLQHSTDTQGIALLSQSENCPKTDKMAAVECTFPGTFLNTHVQGLNHLLEGSKHPEVILPKNFTFSYRPDKTTDVLLRAPYIIHTDKAEEQRGIKLEKGEAEEKSDPPAKRSRKCVPRALQVQARNIIHGPGNWKKGCVVPGFKHGKTTGSPLEIKQQRERHNSKERDRRRRIRLCCDELNLLVPFCTAETDKATTLQWTTAFLKYIRELHGDSLKEDFENTFCGKTGVRLKPNSEGRR
ncbi:hypothetical protein MHYP_G00080760 [Metynnis hypsauchen]